MDKGFAKRGGQEFGDQSQLTGSLGPFGKNVAKQVNDLAESMAKAIHGAYTESTSTLNLGLRNRAEADQRIAAEFDEGEGRAVRQEHPERAGGGRDWGYRPSAVEENMCARRLETIADQPGDMKESRRTSGVLLMRSSDGELNIYKPIHSENYEGNLPFAKKPGALTSREIAAFRLDEHLGFGRVPPTARTAGRIINGRPSGPGMVQQFVKSTFGRKDINDYPETQQQQMAVLDYIMGNFDRDSENYRTVTRGGNLEPVAIDHGRSFPRAVNHLDVVIRSEFVAAHKGKILNDDILRSIDAVDQVRLRAALGDAGIEENAIKGALERLNAIKDTRKIPHNALVLASDV
ncbi:hypothetical protein [Nocardia sp. NPDC057440]|uniref:hypothetical protein n=1 Tax=Nocardia sp. NPDC057440 TaxID=3346134 RepID=UPI00366EB152